MAGRGVTTTTFDFPYRQSGKRLPDKGPVLEAAYREAWIEVARQHPAGTRLYLGGKSMGGRIATQVAAAGGLDPAPAGVVCVGFPLHPPGRAAQRRDRHLPALQPPILFVHGTRDPFGSPDEMRELAGWLPRATLVLVDGGDHSLVTTKRQDPEGTFDAALDRMAGWILNP
jgi:predicted alpha/beta-hydrolase family hydrolase